MTTPELENNPYPSDWADKFCETYHLTPSKTAMISWFDAAMRVGATVPPEWFNTIQVLSDPVHDTRLHCSECGEDFFCSGSLRDVIVACTLHRQERHGSDSD